jgi:uncharacterized protein (TIGR00730 family)
MAMRTRQDQLSATTQPIDVPDAVAPRRKVRRKPKAKPEQLRRPAGLEYICVFCGSGTGQNPSYADAARVLGRRMAEAGIGLVYGGGSLGLMGEVARAVLAHGGRVTGIIPSFLSEKERMLRDVNELIVTEDMHQRKRLMFERSDAFVALPGGVGTLEELIEQLTWSQLGQHAKPIILANIEHFWDPLTGLLEHMRREAFIRPGLEVRYSVVDDAEAIVPTVIGAVMAAAATGRRTDSNLPDRF